LSESLPEKPARPHRCTQLRGPEQTALQVAISFIFPEILSTSSGLATIPEEGRYRAHRKANAGEKILFLIPPEIVRPCNFFIDLLCSILLILCPFRSTAWLQRRNQNHFTGIGRHKPNLDP
jgi:hypothetical protein